MLVSLKMLLRELILPPACLLLLALAGAWLLARHPAGRARRVGLALMGSGLGLLWVISTPVVGDQLQRLADRTPPLDLARAREAQAIVILSGGESNSSAPEYGGEPATGGRLLERVAYGAYVARRTGLPVLVTGSIYEARAMQAVLISAFRFSGGSWAVIRPARGPGAMLLTVMPLPENSTASALVGATIANCDWVELCSSACSRQVDIPASTWALRL